MSLKSAVRLTKEETKTVAAIVDLLLERHGEKWRPHEILVRAQREVIRRLWAQAKGNACAAGRLFGTSRQNLTQIVARYKLG